MSAPQEFDTAKETFDSVDHFVDALDADMLHNKDNEDNNSSINSSNNNNTNATNSIATTSADKASTNNTSDNNNINNNSNNNDNDKTADNTNHTTDSTNNLDNKTNDQNNNINTEEKISNSNDNSVATTNPVDSQTASPTNSSSNEVITVSNIPNTTADTTTSIHNTTFASIPTDNTKDTSNSGSMDSNKTSTVETKNSGKKFWEGKRFYINDAQDAHDNMNDAKLLVRLISDNGGEVLSKLPDVNDPAISTLDKNLLVVSPYNDTNLVTVSPTYIKACVQSNTLLNYQNYLVPFDKNRISNNEKEGEDEQNDKANDDDNAEDQSDGSFDTNVAANNILSNDNLNAAVAVANATIGATTATLPHPTTTVTTGTDAPTTDSTNTDSTPSNNENKTNPNDKDSTSSTNNFKQNETSIKVDVESELSMVDTSDSNENSLKHTPLPPHFSSHKNVFSEDEDQFILDVVRKNPTRRSTHTLFEEISRFMPNHTGNSIRHRYRGYLSKTLDFVYQVDKNGKLVRDERGNLIKTDVLPPSLKRKFTADEDYGLAIAIKKQFYRDAFQVNPESGSSLISHQETAVDIAKRNLTMDPHHVPGNEPSFKDFRVYGRRGPVAREFFKTYAELVPTHTESAWRDRFRKFLLVFGIDAYIDYYEECKTIGKEPEPLKNMTVRKKKRGDLTPGNYNSSLKRAVSASEAVFDPLNSKRRHYMESTEPELIKSDQNTSNISATTVADTNNGNSSMVNTGVSLENKNINSTNHHGGKLTSNEPHVTLEQTPFEVAPCHKSDSAGSITENNKIKSTHRKTTEDYDNELLDEETRNFISSLKDDLNKINNNLPFEYPPDIAEAIRTDYAMEEMKYDTIDPDTIQWPPKIASMDLFLPKFFQLESTREFMKRINDVISRDYEPSQAEMLVQNLADECGIRRNFCTAMLTSLSGDLMVIPRYFLNMFQTDTNPPSNVPGIWTASDDAMLRKGGPRELKELEKKHGTGRIEMRKRFIETALI